MFPALGSIGNSFLVWMVTHNQLKSYRERERTFFTETDTPGNGARPTLTRARWWTLLKYSSFYLVLYRNSPKKNDCNYRVWFTFLPHPKWDCNWHSLLKRLVKRRWNCKRGGLTLERLNKFLIKFHRNKTRNFFSAKWIEKIVTTYFTSEKVKNTCAVQFIWSHKITHCIPNNISVLLVPRLPQHLLIKDLGILLIALKDQSYESMLEHTWT